MHKKYPKFFSVLRVGLAVVFIGIVGTITGILGGLISPQVFLPEDIIQLRPIIFEDKTEQRRTEKDIDTADIVRALAPSIGELYRMPQIYDEWGLDESSFPSVKNFLGYALVGSADGWILLPPGVAATRTEDIRFVDSERRAFRLASRIQDVATGVQYAKLLLLENDTLKPVQFDASSDIGAAKRVFALTARSAVPFDLTPLAYSAWQTAADAAQSPSILKKRFNSSQKFPIEGMPFVTEKKEVIGFSGSRGILPMTYVQSSFTKLLRAKSIERPALGLAYLDLSFLPIGFSAKGRGVIKHGAYIIANKRPSILRGPDGNVSFVRGDIVTRVNNEQLDILKSFSEVIQQYARGDILTLEYLRAGEKKTAQVTLQ